MKSTSYYTYTPAKKSDSAKLREYFSEVKASAKDIPAFTNPEYEIACKQFYENLKILISKS